MSDVVLTLQRLKHTSSATFGEFRDATEQRICYALERPWLNNQHEVSCIPAGQYEVVRRWSQKHSDYVWGLLNVPDRSDIEIHTANLAIPELLGCIAPGTEFGEVSTKHGDGYGIRHSKEGLSLLDDAIGAVSQWTLVVREVVSDAA